jgi:hypothetical protein
MGNRSAAAQLGEFFWSDPLMAAAVVAALIALATTPIAFAVLGRLGWFQARRGRVVMRPSFASVVVGMMLVLGIPAIFLALLVKSRYYDKNRYEFDPNRSLSVLDQGRQYEARDLYEELYKADEAVRAERQRLETERKDLVNTVKKLDEAMIPLRAAARQAPAAEQAMRLVLERLAGVRRSVGLDGPQQLLDDTAPPVALAGVPAPAAAPPAPAANVPPVAAPAAPTGGGLGPAELAAELAAVPEPQRPLAAMLPLSDLPAGWELGKGMGPKSQSRLETFNAENLYEKIDGRAESFVQYGVRGMAYTFYHPAGDEATEVQLYVFEMQDALKALGKYGSEKPEGVKALPLGSEGYQAAGSTFFHAGKYYTQIVSNRDDPKVAAFALELAKRVVAKQKPAPAPSVASGSATPAPAADPADLLKLLPEGSGKANPKYVAQDVFGYSFLSDVFMADYSEGKASWQGFLRPYESPEAAKAVFEKYVETARKDGAKIKEVEGSGADRMVVGANADVGLTDVIFLKGNSVGGANGATDATPAESFARAFAKALPPKLPAIVPEKKDKNPATEDAEDNEKHPD